MAVKKQTWVSPKWNQWEVKHENAKRSVKVFDTQKEAIDFWRALSKKQETEFIVQKENWEIRIKDSHWNDPKNIKW